MARFAGYSASINGTEYAQIAHVDIDPQNSLVEITPQGLVDRSFVGLQQAAPRIGIGSEDLATFLALNSGAFGTDGLPCEDDDTEFFFQKRKSGGVFEESGDYRVVAKKGMLYPEKLTASQGGGAAMLEMIFMALSAADSGEPSGLQDAGYTRPIKLDTATLAGTPAFNAMFFLGPVLFNTTVIPGLKEVSIDFGLQCTAPAFMGQPYPRECSIEARQPVFRFTFDDASVCQYASNSLHGVAASGAGVICQFQKGVLGGSRVSKASTVHVKVTAATGMVNPQTLSVKGMKDGSQVLEFRPTGTLSIATGAAITVG